MINILLGIFYVALIVLTSYLFYYIIKIAIKDAYYELDCKPIESEQEEQSIEDTNNKDQG